MDFEAALEKRKEVRIQRFRAKAPASNTENYCDQCIKCIPITSKPTSTNTEPEFPETNEKSEKNGGVQKLLECDKRQYKAVLCVNDAGAIGKLLVEKLKQGCTALKNGHIKTFKFSAFH
jgi:hypothetical protein